MQTGTVLTPTALMLSGLLVLAGVFSAARPAWAQAPLECPLPAGVPPPAAPRVTAQQVEDGSASLMDFALAVRDQLRGLSSGLTSVAQAAYAACVIRQEGSPYRSGSTYPVQLTPDGRVLLHAKDMALSGRLLNPVIYGAILHALGINPADLADPETALAAFSAAAAGNGGAFNIPNVPGASGYASLYLSVNFNAPLLVLAGFDLSESHLVPISDEAIDYGDPAITAKDVVDRPTLKAFVTEAWEYFVASYRTGGVAAASKARIALRDPNGPWRHGSVYLYFLDLTSNIILFHGGFPDRYELNPLVPIARDVVTGKLVLPQIIAAATSNPEGGFVEYHFDDPADDSDSADIPKVGYAREFTNEFQGPTGSVIQTRYVVGSGFYRRPDGSGDLGGRLENPGPHAFQSGVGALWGWACEAERVEVEIETAQGEVGQYVAAYGLERQDTLDTCGDTDNGFVLLLNWNLLGDGAHTVTALADGVELGRTTVQVTTLGQEFVEGAVGECVADDFPHPGQSTLLEWQQTSQNFVITYAQ